MAASNGAMPLFPLSSSCNPTKKESIEDPEGLESLAGNA